MRSNTPAGGSPSGEFEVVKDSTNVPIPAGRQLSMAENDAQTIYIVGQVTGDSPELGTTLGTQVWVSTDAGRTIMRRFQQPFRDDYAGSPGTTMELSAVGIDIGWNDTGYHWFTANQRHSKFAGGSQGNYLHVTKDKGINWLAPFTKFEGDPKKINPLPTDQRGAGMLWSSTGLEVVSIHKLKFHPKNKNFGVACGFDHSTLITLDGGKKWRIAYPQELKETNPHTTIPKNSGNNRCVYDVAFDDKNPQRLFVAFASGHDWPQTNLIALPLNDKNNSGGIAESDDQGRTWKRYGSDSSSMKMNQQFLSVAYDSEKDTLYAGTKGQGIARKIGTGPWEKLNTGLGKRDDKVTPLVVPQIEINPHNGDVYALLTGDYRIDYSDPEPDINKKKIIKFTNQRWTGIYRLKRGESKWVALQKSFPKRHGEPLDNRPVNFKPWWYPTSFAIDFSQGEEPSTIFLTDQEINGDKHWESTGIWRTTDGGNKWYLVKQFTHPYSVMIDAMGITGVKRIYAIGAYDEKENEIIGIDGERRKEIEIKGGALYSDALGDVGSWQIDKKLTLRNNPISVTVDPNNEREIFYTFFGGGMMHGPRP